MNTFFYSARTTACSVECRYRTCTARCLSRLAEQPFYSKLRLLKGGSNLTSPSSMELRSGDLILLYAADIEDIDTLCSMKDILNPFRIILIVAADNLIHYGRHYSLKPRYTTTVDNSMEKLNAVISRMTTTTEQLSGDHETHEGNTYA
jgi:hypothetical protein